MGRNSNNKRPGKKDAAPATERRKHPRRSKTTTPTVKPDPDACLQCAKKLSGNDERALFVEEEVGRIFCSEACIGTFFTPEIERLEKEYLRRLSPNDLTPEERESLAHLRWITLQEPDEIWREKTLEGDYRYTLISEFKPENRKIWSICVCLFLRGEPSFLYIALVTRNAAMVNHYRKGEPIEWVPNPHHDKAAGQSGDAAEHDGEAVDPAGSGGHAPTDYLADEWTEDDTMIAQLSQERKSNDIPHEEFDQYQACLDETLETPDEVWTVESESGEDSEDSIRTYHFIRQYPADKSQDRDSYWFVIIARETRDDEEQIEIIDAFPTRDSSLVEQYRRGKQEVGQSDATKPSARVVH